MYVVEARTGVEVHTGWVSVEGPLAIRRAVGRVATSMFTTVSLT